MAIVKILLSGFVIWLASELGKRSGKLGGLVLSLPLTSLAAFVWIWIETKDANKVSQVSKETLIFIIPSLIFFIALHLLIQKQINFYLSFTFSILLTLISYFVFFKIRGEI